MKKIVIGVLLCILIFTSTNFVFADSTTVKDVKQFSDLVERIMFSNDSINLRSSEGVFMMREGENYVSIPNRGTETVKAQISDIEIGIKLPSRVGLSRGDLIGKDTVVYTTRKDDFRIFVQATKNISFDKVAENGIRTFILLNNSSAPTQYDFEFVLPKGCRFVSGYELNIEEVGMKEIAVMGDDGFIYGVIKEPWAKDATGESVETYYTYSDTTLMQHISVDADTKFPVVADPWYGTSIKTEDFGSKFEQDFTDYPANQGTSGFKFYGNGGYISYQRGNGITVNAQVDVGFNYPPATISASIGFANNGSSVGVMYPVTGGPGWYKLKVTETYFAQKYIIFRRWKDPATGRVSWKEFSRSARREDFKGIDGIVEYQHA